MATKQTRKDPQTKPRGEGPSREEIALRAYEIYMARGGMGGTPEDDWLRAERELREDRAAPRRPARARKAPVRRSNGTTTASTTLDPHRPALEPPADGETKH